MPGWLFPGDIQTLRGLFLFSSTIQYSLDFFGGS